MYNRISNDYPRTLEEDDDEIGLLAPEESQVEDIEMRDLNRKLDETDVWIQSAVSLEDDPQTPAFTLRTVLIGLVWSTFLSITNCLFSFRLNSFQVPNGLVLLLSYPIGIFLEAILPKITVFGIDLNPGPFSVKEHALICAIAGSSGGLPYGVDNVVGQRFKIFMGNTSITFWNSLPWILGTQFVGYGVAGVSRRYLVKPRVMLWPSILPTVALLNSFHAKQVQETSTKYKMSKFTFFWIVFLSSFCWAWIPSFFAPALGMISILCLFTSNRTARFLGSSSYQEGVGLFALTLDWSVISGRSPIVTPFWAGLNYFIGSAFWLWLIVPLVHFTNPFGVGGDKGYLVQSNMNWGGSKINISNSSSAFDPFPNMNDAHIFTNKGAVVKVGYPGLLNANYSLNQTFYNENGPFYLTASFTVGYLVSFINIAAVTMHVILWHGPEIWKQFRYALDHTDGHADPQANIMRRYKDVPDLFYYTFLFVFSIVLTLSGEFTAFRMPWWSTVFGICLGSIYTIPIGVIQAISGFQMGLNVLTEFLIGLLTPGDTIGVMCFKSLGYNMVIQALDLLSDLKIGHYLHISPIAMFAAQMIGTFIGAVLNLATALWAETGLAYQFEHDRAWNPQSSYGVFTNAGGIWGAIGPARFFGIGSPYQMLLWGFLIGLILPVIPWLLNRYYPHPNWRLINFPLLTRSMSTGSSQAFIVVPFLINFIFNKLIYTHRREWWEKYNFILGIALDSSTAIAILCITLFQTFLPDFVVPTSPLHPKGPMDYYCTERSYR